MTQRQQDAEGRHERGDPGLGDQRPHHLLPARHRRGAASLPDDGAGLPGGDRPGGPPQILEQEGRLPDCIVACVGGGSNSMGIFHPFLGGPGAPDRRGGGRTRHRDRQTRRHPIGGTGRGAARHAELPAAGRARPGAGGPLHLRRPGLPRRGAGAQLTSRSPGGRSMWR